MNSVFGLKDQPDTSKWKYQNKLAIYQWDRVESSGHPYAEDVWKSVKINKLTFGGVKLCGCCKVTIQAMV
jgi:uncharacterized protein YcbX